MSNHSTISFRNIPGFPGYRVGSDGSVWSLWAVGVLQLGKEWKKLKMSRHSGGYAKVKMKRRVLLVHRLVLESFVGPCPEGMECCHNNGNRSDNRTDNLRWGTRQDNTDDRLIHGTTARGETCGLHKLTEVMVREIRKSPQRSASYYSAKFGVHERTVRDVRRRHTWKHLP